MAKPQFTPAIRYELAARLSDLQRRAAENRPLFKGAYRGIVSGAWIRIEPKRITPFASTNRNRAESLPGGAGWNAQSALAICARYKQAGIKPYFFWLRPNRAARRIEKDLLAAGLRRMTVRYCVQARRAELTNATPTDFVIRRFSLARDAKFLRDYPDEETRVRILRPNRIRGLTPFVAWHKNRPVGIGSLFIHNRLGYLQNGATLKEFRNRGAQSALIAARINFAIDKGCDWLLSETVLLRNGTKTSFSNLNRQGFALVFERRVFRGN